MKRGQMSAKRCPKTPSWPATVHSPHLFNVVPPLGLRAALPRGHHRAWPPPVVAAQAEDQSDVRLLVGDSNRNPTQAGRICDSRATTLPTRCDAMSICRHADARVRYLRESSSVAGESWDAVVVHDDTGEPGHRGCWSGPDERTDAVPSWFISTAGRLRQNNGLITVPLAAGLRPSRPPPPSARPPPWPATSPVERPRLTTLAVGADIGRFEISRFNEASRRCWAGSSSPPWWPPASDHIEPDVQLALTWPGRRRGPGRARRRIDALRRRPRPHQCGVPQVRRAARRCLARRGEFAAMDQQRPARRLARLSLPVGHRLATGLWHRQPTAALLPADHSARGHRARSAPSSFPAAVRPLAPMTRAAIVAAVGESVAMAMADPIAEAVRLAERAAARPVSSPASPTVLLATLAAPTARRRRRRLAEVAPVAAPAPARRGTPRVLAATVRWWPRAARGPLRLAGRRRPPTPRAGPCPPTPSCSPAPTRTSWRPVRRAGYCG